MAETMIVQNPVVWLVEERAMVYLGIKAPRQAATDRP
jgi:hypothetical protein